MRDGFSRKSIHAYNTIQSVVGEIESGLIVNLRAQVAGEVLSELVALGKEILTDDNDAAKNVAAVLIRLSVCASYVSSCLKDFRRRPSATCLWPARAAGLHAPPLVGKPASAGILASLRVHLD
jgi:hypothetical protein